MKIVFCQISTDLINEGIKPDISSRFYDTFWESKQQDGFFKSRDFWEIPLWIAELSHTIPNDWERELHVVQNIDESVSYLSSLDVDIIAFSCLDVNRELVGQVIDSYVGTADIALGGYAIPDSYDALWFDSIEQFCKVYVIEYSYGTDYNLFKGYKTVPRLTMSTGCKHRCKFCTVPNEVERVSMLHINQQVDSFKFLDFELIYLNDKTFGQAENYKLLDGLYGYIKQNILPDFQGFIVQTTCNQLVKPGFIDFLKLAKVKYVELGIESCNDEILKAMKKPQSVKLIHKALKLCNDNKLDVIPNIIIGLPNENQETYNHTLSVLRVYKLYSLNIYNLAIYEDSQLSDEIEISDDDTNELIKDKSYHSQADRKAIDNFYQAIFSLGCEIVNDRQRIRIRLKS